jgi:hypothetical protein
VRGEWQEADIGTAPAWVLERSSFVSAGSASGTSSELVARGAWSQRITGSPQAIGAECRHFSQ